jgi:hypothetical protein
MFEIIITLYSDNTNLNPKGGSIRTEEREGGYVGNDTKGKSYPYRYQQIITYKDDDIEDLNEAFLKDFKGTKSAVRKIKKAQGFVSIIKTKSPYEEEDYLYMSFQSKDTRTVKGFIKRQKVYVIKELVEKELAKNTPTAADKVLGLLESGEGGFNQMFLLAEHIEFEHFPKLHLERVLQLLNEKL